MQPSFANTPAHLRIAEPELGVAPSETREVTPATVRRPRQEWVDHAKGICIFFVVMLHVCQEVQYRLGVGWLEHVVQFARPFRMPDFFLIAGLFLASSMKRPWRSYLDSKVVHFLYFYALWATVNFAVFDLHVKVSAGDGGPAIALAYLARYLDPSGPLWFIHILPIFFVVTRLTRRVPWWLMWLGAAALHGAQIKTGYHVPDEFGSRFVFFYSGYALATQWFRIADWARQHLHLAIGYLVVWGVVNGMFVAADLAGPPIASLILGYAGALAVVLMAVILSTFRWAWPVRYLGENSIVIYLGEVVVSAVLVRLTMGLPLDSGTLGILLTFATIVGTLVLWRVVLRTPAAFLYRRPGKLRL